MKVEDGVRLTTKLKIKLGPTSYLLFNEGRLGVIVEEGSQMSSIRVALTTTKYVANSMVPEEKLKRDNIPVCVAECGMAVFAGPDKEYMEHVIAQGCKKMAKTVSIDSRNRTVFIGEDPRDLQSALVEYKEEGTSDYCKSFFERWDDLNVLVFIFQNTDVSSNSCAFCLRGIWVNNHWESLDVFTSSNIHIV